MATKLSIKLKIVDREYPMQVDAEEEAQLRTVGKIINEKIKTYREQFGIEDKQDLLAMFAIDCLMEAQAAKGEKKELEQIFLKKLSYLNSLLKSTV